MKITTKDVNRFLTGVIASMPAIPYIMKPRRRISVTNYILGGVGIALVGGLAAVMLFSPRTRSRALVAAKDTYGKVNERISHRRVNDVAPMSNGLVDRIEQSEVTTGL